MNPRNLQNDTKKNQLRIFEVLYLLFFGLLAFVYSPEIIDPVLLPRQIYLSFFVLIIGIVICTKHYKKSIEKDVSFFKLTLPWILLVIFVIYSGSAIKSLVISESIYVISKLLIEILFFSLTYFLLIKKELSIESIVKSILIFCSISVLIAFYQIIIILIHGNGLINNLNEIKSSFANKNLFSFILFLTIPFALTGISQSKAVKYVSYTLLGIIVLTLFLVRTRSSVIALLVFITTYAILHILYASKKIKATKQVAVIVFLIGLILSVFVVNKQYYAGLKNSNTVKTRVCLWENSIKMAQDNLWLGVGAGNWQFNYSKYGLDKFPSEEIKNSITTFQRPHNDFLWVLCETGILGLITYISVFFISIFYCFKLLNRQNKKQDKIMISSILSCIFGYLFIAFADFPMERIEHQILLLTLLAIVSYYYHNQFLKNDTTTYKFSIIFPATIIFMSVAISIFICFFRYKGELNTRKMYEFHQMNSWPRMIKSANVALNPAFYTVDPTSIPMDWYKGVAFFAMKDTINAQISFQQAYELSPYNIHVINNLATCYEIRGYHNEAEMLYKKALGISENFEESRLNLCAIYFNSERFDNAFKMIDKCDISSTDTKYRTFLPIVLKAYLNNKVDIALIEDGEIIEIYFASKKNNLNFVEYIKFKYEKQ